MPSISVCTVVLHSDARYVQYWLRSLKNHSSLVSEIFVSDIAPTSTRFARQLAEIWGKPGLTVIPLKCSESSGHASGLKAGVDRTTGDYVLLSDPDVFYYLPAFDEFLVDVHEKHDVLVSGVTHWCWQGQAYQQFPSIIQCLMRRRDVPPDSFLAGATGRGWSYCWKIARTQPKYEVPPGSWLTKGIVPEVAKNYPEPEKVFDAGSKLYEYCRQKGGRWISYHGKADLLTAHGREWTRVYRTQNFNNFSLDDDFGNRPFLYHHARASRSDDQGFQTFVSAWKRRRKVT